MLTMDNAFENITVGTELNAGSLDEIRLFGNSLNLDIIL